MQGKLDTASLRQLSTNPTNPHDAKAAKDLLTHAKANGTSIPLETISDTAKKFIEVSQKSPDAWSAALASLDYRSFLNAGSVSPVAGLNAHPSRGTVYDVWTAVKNQSGMLAFHYGSVPISQAARFNRIGTNRNANLPTGDAFLEVDNATGILLDGMEIRNVIVRNSTVTYNGGPVILQNVYFINCTFQIVRNQKGQAISANLLESSPVTYSTM